jgi:hypothetical protein
VLLEPFFENATTSHTLSIGMASTTNCYDLYQNDYSLCSLMTRYTFAVRQNPKRGADDVVLRQHNVDIFFNLEQLNEKFLVEINPKGQVSHLLSTKSHYLTLSFNRSLSWSMTLSFKSLLLRALILRSFLPSNSLP